MATYNILWYTGSVGLIGFASRDGSSGLAGYKNFVNQLVTAAAAFGNTWNVTFWDSGARPSGSFHVLVLASTFGGWSSDPNYAALVASGLAFSPATDRVVVASNDTDWHWMNFDDVGDDPTVFNSCKGLLLNAVNWAAGGTTLGAVFLGYIAQFGTPSLGLTGFSEQDTITGDSETVINPFPFPGHAINLNLTPTGMTQWGNSWHRTYVSIDAAKWDILQTATNQSVPQAILLASKPGGASVNFMFDNFGGTIQGSGNLMI